MKRSFLIIVTLIAHVPIGGCSFYKGAVDQSMEINRSVAEGELESLFLNVLRASERMPPVFTVMSEIKVSAPDIEGSANLEIPFGVDAKNAYTLSPGIASKYGLSYDIDILQSQEFMRGFLAPIKPDLFKYYWDMGWHKSLLLIQQIKLANMI